jgi:hypothetical protein
LLSWCGSGGGGGAYLSLTLPVSQVLVSVSCPPLGLMTRYLFLLTFAGFVFFVCVIPAEMTVLPFLYSYFHRFLFNFSLLFIYFYFLFLLFYIIIILNQAICCAASHAFTIFRTAV